MATNGTKQVVPFSTWMVGKKVSPVLVLDDGKPYQPVMLFVVDLDGQIRAFTLGRADHGKALLREVLSAAETAPLAGAPGHPTLVFVEDEELARQIRKALPNSEVRVRATPELDAIIEELFQQIDQGEEDLQPGGAFLPDVQEHHKSPWYQAAAEMYARAPWMILPEDRALLRVTATPFGLRGAMVCLIGELGESLGFVVFNSRRDFDQYLEAADCLDRNGPPSLATLPEHLALNYIRVKELPAPVRKQLKTVGHPLAGPNAFPELVHLGSHMVCLPLSVDDLRRGELLCRVITWLVDNEPRLADPDLDVTRIRHRIRVRIGDEDVPVTVSLQ